MSKKELIEAEKKAAFLFKEIEKQQLISPGKSEKELNTDIFNLAYDLFGIKKYWHKRIVRAGRNTLHPYKSNPENLLLKEDDILFIDFGPVFEDWEADFGRTYVLGNNESKIKLMKDVESAWYDCKKFFDTQSKITGAELYAHTLELAKQYGWTFGGEIAGHLIGHFPPEKLEGEDRTNYLHPENNVDVFTLGKNGNKRDWILEIHFVNLEKEIGGFFEQLLT